MLACGIETSGAKGSVALVESGAGDAARGEGPRSATEAVAGGVAGAVRVVCERAFGKGLRHGQAVIPALAACLEEGRVSKGAIDLFVVGTGPGSYTGMRVGIVTGKALSFALAKPLLGVPSFDALAAGLPESLWRGAAAVLVAQDARRDHVYWGLFRPKGGGLERSGAFDVVPVERALEGLPVLPLVVQWEHLGVSEGLEVVIRHDGWLWCAAFRWAR